MPKKALVRIEEGATAASAAYGCAALLDAELENQLGPAGADGEGLSDAGRLAVRVARRMVYLRHNLEACNEAVARVEDELSRWRRQLDQANRKLYEVAKRLRGLCRHNMPPGEGDEFLGLRGTLPRKPSELHTALSAVVHRLADAEWPMPERQWEGFDIDRQKLVRSLVELHGELGRAIRAVKDGETRESVTKAGRKRAAGGHNAFVGKGSLPDVK